MITSRGLYNPLTLSGTIIVGGVAASVHSDWFLDSIFHTLLIPAWLPAAYQAVLAPARLLYAVMGMEIYTQVRVSADLPTVSQAVLVLAILLYAPQCLQKET